MKKNFNEWLDKFINKNEIDKLEVLNITKNSNDYYFTVEQIMKFLGIIEPQEQQEIKKVLEKIDEDKEEIKDYFACLAVGFINAMESETIEDTEEAM